MVGHTMDVTGWLRKQLEEASPDLLRAMVKEFAEALMSADADAVCGGGYGERSPERVNRCNGYRERGWDTRVGSVADRAAIVRLLGAVLAEQNDESAVARRYTSAESIAKALTDPADEPEEVIAIAAAA